MFPTHSVPAMQGKYKAEGRPLSAPALPVPAASGRLLQLHIPRSHVETEPEHILTVCTHTQIHKCPGTEVNTERKLCLYQHPHAHP